MGRVCRARPCLPYGRLSCKRSCGGGAGIDGTLQVGQFEPGWRGSGQEGPSFHGAVSQDEGLICSGVRIRYKYRFSRRQGPPRGPGDMEQWLNGPGPCGPLGQHPKPSSTESTDPGSSGKTQARVSQALGHARGAWEPSGGRPRAVVTGVP